MTFEDGLARSLRELDHLAPAGRSCNDGGGPSSYHAKLDFKIEEGGTPRPFASVPQMLSWNPADWGTGMEPLAFGATWHYELPDWVVHCWPYINGEWTTVIRGATLVPIISAFTSLLTTVAGLYPAMDLLGRFQGMHTAPFLAGFCSTAIFAAMLEYLRGFKLRWIIIAGMNLAILLATQARAPLGAVILFMLCIFLLSDNKLFPMKRKVDLVMGSMVPGLLLLGPVLVFALGRFVDQGSSSSGRDLMWPYFLEAIETRPLFGFGLGAGKLIVNPDDPLIKLLGSTAAHNEYLRLSVDGGIIGCALIFIALIAWIWGGSRNLAPAEKLVLRAALAGVLLHSGFDNTLIATTSVMQFCLFGAILARGRAEAKQGLRGQTPHGRGSVRHAADTLTWRQPRPG